jgi:ABC-type nickel/cobalt efflux system permease component RcnA
MVLIVAFSVGLAAVVSAIGLLAIGARRTFSRMSFDGPVVRALPAVSALAVLGIGVAMTVRALPGVV